MNKPERERTSDAHAPGLFHAIDAFNKGDPDATLPAFQQRMHLNLDLP